MEPSKELRRMEEKVGREYIGSKISKTKRRGFVLFFNKEEIFNTNKCKRCQMEHRVKRRHWICQLEVIDDLCKGRKMG